MPRLAPFKSDFLILDVKKGRRRLAERIARGQTITVWIKATLDTQHSRDDGTSIEFSGVVHVLKISNGEDAR